MKIIITNEDRKAMKKLRVRVILLSRRLLIGPAKRKATAESPDIDWFM